MDLVIRGRSQDQRGARPWDTGRTRVEPDRTGPEWSQAVQDQRAWREESEGAPKDQAAAAVIEGTPDGARGAGQGSSAEWPSLTQLQQFQSKPASDERVGRGAQVSSSFSS